MSLIVLSGGAAKGLVNAVEPGFRRQTGIGVEGTFGAVGAMREKLLAGAPADLLILTTTLIAELAAAGRIVAGSAVDIGQVATAVAVRTGDPLPLIGKPDLLGEALAQADELHFPDPKLATAGIHVAKVIASLQLDGILAKRLRVHPHGTRAMQALAASTAAHPLGITQASEILAVRGVTLVGPLTAPHGLSTTYTIAIVRGTRSEDAARRFIEALTNPAGAGVRLVAGFDPPA